MRILITDRHLRDIVIIQFLNPKKIDFIFYHFLILLKVYLE
jgi:hypothetical protein